MQNRRARAVILLSLWLLLAVVLVPASATEPAVLQFVRLPEADQRAYLTEALKSFRDKVSNISCSVTVSTQNREYDPVTRQVGSAVLNDAGVQSFVLRRIGRSYRIEADSRPVDPPPDVVTPKAVDGYDALLGVRRCYNELAIDDNVSYRGVIASERGDVSANCFFFQYLGDDRDWYNDPGSAFLRHVDTCRVTRVDEERAEAEVSIPYPAAELHGGESGQCRIVFDLSRGALVSRFEKEKSSGGSLTYRFHAEYSDPIEVGAVAVPTRMYALAWSTAIGKKITVYEGTVANLDIGHLNPADLEVVFPPGTEVSDDIADRNFRIAEDGTETDPRIARGGLPEAAPAAPARSSITTVVFLANLALLAGAAMLIGKRARARRRGQRPSHAS